MTELEDYIRSHFDLIQPEELNKVSALFEPLLLKKGGYFLNEGKRRQFWL